MSEIELPPIIEILQLFTGISDKEAMAMWNMWVPYVIICDENNVNTIIEKAENKWIIARKIGDLKEKNTWEKHTLSWVWIWKSEIII